MPPSLPGFFSFRPLLTNEGTVGWQSTIEPCRGYRWFLFATSALTGIGLFFIPAFIIRPFHHRTPSALSVAMALRQRSLANSRRRPPLSPSGARPLEHRQHIAQNHSCCCAFKECRDIESLPPVLAITVVSPCERGLRWDPRFDRPTCFRKMVGERFAYLPKTVCTG